MMRQLGGNQGGFMMSSKGIISSTSRCQDCGNQAKKECAYMRCRTCCKSKGFHCQTHVKSTWIPLYRRRQRQIQQHQYQERQHFHHHHHHDHHDRQGNYPRRLITHNPGSSHQGLELQQEHDGDDDQGQKSNFPAEVTATATFHVVRVSSMADDGAAQYAYQTSVGIGGHVFKGILYDQGPDHHDHHTTTTTTTSSYGGLVAADQVGGLGLMFHQLPNFVTFGSGSSASATTLARSEANIDYFGANNCSSSSSSSSSSSTVNVVGDQRLLFVGSSSSWSMTCPMFQQSSTTATTTADFMPAGMQFFPNRKS